MAIFDTAEIAPIIIIYISGVIGIIWALIQGKAIANIKIEGSIAERQASIARPQMKKASQKDEEQCMVDEGDNHESVHEKNVWLLMDIGNKISEGANAFLYAEYKIMAVFIVLFGIVVYVIVDVLGARDKSDTKYIPYATISFVVGATTSIICGLIGMKIAVMANYRVTYKAITSLEDAFSTAYRAGCVMGFGMVSVSLMILATIMLVYFWVYEPAAQETSDLYPKTYEILMDLIAGYGLGGSSMALFGRVGGGIYTKAADVGADLVGKVEEGLDEDSPRNPATIADNVGDNVGDIAGMGSDLFGSFAESTCAALVLIASQHDVAGSHKGMFNNDNKQVIWYPLMISAVGILASWVTSIVGIFMYKVNTFPKIQKALNLQLFISTVLMLAGLWVISPWMLPSSYDFLIDGASKNPIKSRNWYHPAICATMGLISGFLIGISTDYYTSNSHSPVREMAEKCQSGAAINVIYGLAVGYLSTIIPIFLLSISVIVCMALLDMLGVALAAIGMLSTLSIGLAIDAYGPISDNAGGIAEMAQIGEEVRDITDALDAAGNTTAAVGKGFAIGSAALVALALYGAFINRASHASQNALSEVKVNDGWVFGSMFVGAMLPFWFSALTMKSVGKAADEMVQEVRRQFKDPRVRNGEIEPDHKACIEVSTKASLKEMIAPGILVMFTPIFCGCVFGTRVVAGILPGSVLSGIQLAISMSNTGGAWDNAKKYIESGQLKVNGQIRGKGSDEHTAAVIGDTIGDPLKDTSGPSLNILVKLMAIISLVFANGFSQTSWLAGPLGINSD